ncbi:hypothetical protein JTE90_013661 [Oedothorax gibbosus]|uniref:snRNA-activating protein complex subunit 4 n=1 Tax=Oedothorax gibbosus TaxID=931172 RepID=A0AAV6VE15_9ARAC|nr:hypothetical protein JTE90_013661 [Oedothorax gibbosus]
MSYSDCNMSPEGEELSLDDCDALLKFPYQDYVQDKRKGVNFSDIPELGISANLSLNDDSSQSDVSVDKTSENVTSDDIKVIEASLAKTRAMLKSLIEDMTRLEGFSTKNKNKLILVNEHLKKDEKSRSLLDKNRVSKPIRLFAAPYFRDINGRDPPDNEDTILKTKNCDVTAHNHPPRQWTPAERDKLVEGVGANALSFILKPYKAKRDFLKSKMKDKDATDEDIANLKKQIISIEKQMKAQSERKYKDLVAEANDNIDWMVISATDLEGHRTEEECKLLWDNYLCPFVNKEPFTRAEDDELKHLAEKHNRRNWSAVTAELSTNRSVFQVFERYQTKLNKELLKKFWTPEEDEMLLSLVEKYKLDNFINWNAICSRMEGRSRYQIVNRYERTLSEDIRRDPWSHQEDAMLYACVAKFGKHWTKMQEFFTGRPIYSIRERYVNTLNPGLRLGCWSKAEDMELIKLIKKHGYGKWSYISRFLPGRTDNMCYNRTRRLIIHSLVKYGEYDINWDTKNTKELVDRLKPVASSKACIQLNAKLRERQETAHKTLKAALQKITPLVDYTFDLEAMDLSAVNLNMLRLLCKELGSSEAPSKIPKYQPKYLPFKAPMFASKYKRRRRDEKLENTSFRDSNTSDEESENEETYNEDNSFSDMERIYLRKILEHKFQEEASIVFNSNANSKKPVCLNTKETLEYNLYKNYLQKKLHCKKYWDGETVEYIYSGVEVNNSMHLITHFFIQPESTENKMIVLPPNFSTLHGLELVFNTEKRLRRTGDFAAHSMNYIMYVTGYSQDPPLCLSCSVRRNACPVECTYEQVVGDMKSEMLIVDEVMHREALIETRAGFNQYPECQCEALKISRADVELLAKRFLSLFLWPFLLHTTGVTKEQEEMIYERAALTPAGRPAFTVKKLPTPKGRRPKSPFTYANKTNTNSHIKRTYTKKATSIKREDTSESEFETKSPTPTPSSALRRSSRKCVINRKSLIKSESDEEMT